MKKPSLDMASELALDEKNLGLDPLDIVTTSRSRLAEGKSWP
jgi:hypothetical protein